jgi:flagellar motor switch protein FliN/FliY
MQSSTVSAIDLPSLPQHAASQERLKVDLPFINDLRVTADVVLGQTSVTVGKLRALAKDEVLVLDRALDAAIDLVVDGHVIARGMLVAVGDQFGFRVTEIPR